MTQVKQDQTMLDTLEFAAHLNEVLQNKRANFKTLPTPEKNPSNLDILEIVVAEIESLCQAKDIRLPPLEYGRMIRLAYSISLKDEWAVQLGDIKQNQ